MEVNAIEKIPFDFVQCSSTYIKSLEKEKKIVAGTLYFVLDTKQILLGRNPEMATPMGKGTGVRFATKKTDSNKVNKNVNFVLKDLEDQSCYPQIDDLIFNSDGSFYRVIKIDGSDIKTTRLTVAGGGGSGGGGGSSSIGSGSSASIEMNISGLDVSAIPSFIIEGESPDFKIPVTKGLELMVNGSQFKPVTPTVAQIIQIDDMQYRSKIVPWQPFDIEFKSSWFKAGAKNNITLFYEYSSKYYEYPLGSVEALNLTINDTDFKSSIRKPFSLGSFNFDASIVRIDSAIHRIYFSLKDENGNELTHSYPQGVEQDEFNDNRYYFTPSSAKFSPSFSNLPYGIFTFEAQHAVVINSQLIWGTSYSYKVMSTANKQETDAPLLLVDTTKIDGKTFQSTENIQIPIILYDNSNSNNSTGRVTISYSEEINRPSETFDVVYGTYTILRILKPTPGESYEVTVSYEGAEEVSFVISVTSLGVIIPLPVVELTAEGRSNAQNEEVRKTWINTTSNNTSLPASVTLENFTWTDEGTGWNANALHFAGDAKATVNFNPYQMSEEGSTIPQTGMSILLDFNIKNFTRRNDIQNEIIKCFDSDKNFGFKIFGDYIEFKGGSAVQEAVKLAFMEKERMHLAIVFSKENSSDTENNDTGSLRGLIEFYLNGVLVAGRLYLSNQFPSKFENTVFTIGNKNAIIDLYSINIFNEKLESADIVREYLTTLTDSSVGAELEIKNDIYDKSGNIDVDKIKDNAKIPVMIITGELPTIKADKTKKVRIQFSNPEFPDRDFDTMNEMDYGSKDGLVNIEVQGTSSQFYPVKNWKIKKLTKYGEKYQLTDTQIPTSTFCLKADYAESTSSHNTQNANLIETFYDKINYKKNPAQIKDERCRTTIYGYPIVVFNKYTDSQGQVHTDFLGKYNFNFDKGSKEVFGFKDDNAESWEFKDNDDISGMSLDGFQTAVSGELYTWDKWKMTFYSDAESGTTRTAYFPLDDSKTEDMPEEFKTLLQAPIHRGFEYKLEERHSSCNSNYDYVKSLIQPYINYMKTCSEDESERTWWASAKCDEPRIVPLWATYFEPRYCETPLLDMYGNEIEYLTGNITDKDTSDQEMETIYDISRFAELYNWILSTGGNDPDHEIHATDPAGRTKGQVFKEDLGKHFDLDGLCLYYVYTHFAIMADQRAKNMFFTYWKPTPRVDENGDAILDSKGEQIIDGGLWCPWFYDNDTSFGIDNDGFERFSYDSEDDDTDTEQVYQGEKSILWKNLKRYFNSELSTVYKKLRANVLTQENLYKYFINDAVDKWPAAIYNEDSNRKYIQYAFKKVILSNDKTDEEAEREDVLSKLRGNGLAHFKRFVPDRLSYCDGRWGLTPTNSSGDLISLQLRPAAMPDLNDRKVKLYQYLEKKNLLNNTFIDDDELETIIANNTFSDEEFTKYYEKYKTNYSNDSNFIASVDSIDVSLNFIPFTTGFYHLLFGADLEQLKDKFTGKFIEGQTKQQNFTVTSGGNNVTYFIPPEHILDPGDLSQLAPINLLADKATKLETFRVGNKDKTPMLVSVGDSNRNGLDGYSAEEVNIKRDKYRNRYPESFTMADKNSLKVFDFSNIGSPSSAETAVLSLNACPNIREVYARNSKIDSISFREGGYLEKLILPDTVREFVIKKQLLLTEENTSFENMYIDGKNPYRNLIKIVIENCDKFNSKEFLLKCLDNNSMVSNYNIPDKYITDPNKTSINKTIRITGIDYEKNEDGTPKVLAENNGEKIYSSWVFKNNEELKTFVEALEYYTTLNADGEQPVILKGENNKKESTDKIYLQGVCYALGNIDGGLKERLMNLVTGDFTILSNDDQTSYTINFYYIHPDPIQNGVEYGGDGFRRPILTREGNPYSRVVKQGAVIGDPYQDGTFHDDKAQDYVKDVDNFEGLKYTHNGTHSNCHLWMTAEKDVIPTVVEEEDDALTSKQIMKTCDVYAVYKIEKNKHKVRFFNIDEELEEFQRDIPHGDVYDLLTSLPMERGSLDYPIESKKDYYEFTGWYPNPEEPIVEDIDFRAQYDYTAYQTLGILNETIEIFKANIYKIPEYAFEGCNSLQKIILPVANQVVQLEHINAFENSSVKEENGTCRIYVPEHLVNEYKVANSWKKFSNSITAITEEEGG